MAILKGTEEPHDPVCFRPDGKRLDGRAADELRPFSCEVGILKNAQGSALVRHGGNQIYAAIYGPREVHPRHLAKPDRGILRVYYRMCTFSVHERKSPAPNRRENEISKVIREALKPVLFLEAYPESQIEIYIEVVAADGGTRCASTTAASLALADAGIPMRSMVVGVAAGKAQDRVLLDLGDKEDKVGQADVPAVVIMKTKEISLLQFDGEMTLEEMEKGFDYILKGADVIYAKQLAALKGKYEDIQEQAEIEDDMIKQSQEESSEPVKSELQTSEAESEDEPEKTVTNQESVASSDEDSQKKTSSQSMEPVEPENSQAAAINFNEDDEKIDGNLDTQSAENVESKNSEETSGDGKTSDTPNESKSLDSESNTKTNQPNQSSDSNSESDPPNNGGMS